jgi:UDP-2-acetamido-2-deoxy-ribo-hexuluronate aminotransferase
MNHIQMVDLLGQYNNIKNDIDLAIEEVMKSSAFINGPQVKDFEKGLREYSNAGSVIACANGTDALQIAMMALDLKTGDEIIVPAFTYIATAETAAFLGLKLVLCDVDPNTFNINAAFIEKLITPSTKAIVPVHLFGQSSDMETICSIAKKYNLFVIEDNAQAIGAKFTFPKGDTFSTGTMGDIGTTSFFPSKNLGCYGDGGAIFTKDDAIAKKIRMLCNHGQEKKYYHDIVGVNSRLDTLQAAILNVKLKKLDLYIAARQYAANAYDKAFANHAQFSTPFRDPNSTHVFHQYTLKIKNKKRNELKSYLEMQGIPSMIYYPLPIHFQKAFSFLKYKPNDFPISEELCESVLSLPMHTELTDDQLNYIIKKVLGFFK